MQFVQSMFIIAQDNSSTINQIVDSHTAAASGSKPTWWPFVEDIAYLVAAMLFIFGLKKLSSPRTARKGNAISAVGMLVAILATCYFQNWLSVSWILAAMVIGSGIGWILAVKIKMTGMPQLVGLFNGFGGLASLLVATSEYVKLYQQGSLHELTFDRGVTLGLALLIGGVTWTGSLIAYLKLQGTLSGKPIKLPGQLAFNALAVLACLTGCIWFAIDPSASWIIIMLWILGWILGVTLVIPIGGADMPVAICLLNSYSGLAAAMTGFILPTPNKALMVSGALVGASGIILTYIMCKAMNRSLANVLFAGIGTSDSAGPAIEGAQADKTARSVDAEEFAMLLEDAAKVVIVPGYGMAVAQAQYAVRDLFHKLVKKGIDVKFGIHPVAGRMPGHMNVLLAEVDMPYETLCDLETINAELERTDIALVIGANDVVNPAAREDKGSPIYGMPIIDVDKARTVVVSKRSLRPGYAGVANPLFYLDNTLMLFGDAKEKMQEVTAAIED